MMDDAREAAFMRLLMSGIYIRGRKDDHTGHAKRNGQVR